MRDKHELTPKQKRFADLYMQTGNGGRSYVEAGFKVKNMAVAYSMASEMLRKPTVASYIREMAEKEHSEHIASRREVLELLTKIARGFEDEEMIIAYQNKGTYEIAKRRVPPKDRTKALELLGKRYAMFIEKQQSETFNEHVNYVAEWGSDESPS
jgi:phage terminase small subunit